MIINFSNIGSGGGSGSGYTLPIASQSTLGGIKVGSGLSIDSTTGLLSVSGASSDDVVYEYDAITALTKAERATLFQEIKTMVNNGKKVWVYREQNYDRYWFLIDTATNSLMYFTAKNSDSINRFELNSIGNYSQTKIYYNPKASTSTLGCIKVGSGLTIDNSGVLSVSGGSSDSNYVIVDALSAITTPKEGMTAWVNSGTQLYGPYTVISFNSSECSGGQLNWDGDYAYLTGDDPTQIDNGNGWYVPTENWGTVGGRSNLLAKYDSSTHIVSIMFAFNVTNLSVNISDTTYSETSEYLSVDNDGYFARRIKGNWIRNEYHLEKMTAAELAQAHSEIITMSGQSYTDIFWQTQDGGITKATYWMIDWNDSAAVRCVACQGDSWYTMKFSSDGSIGEKGSGRVTDKVAKWEFNWDRATSAWTAVTFEQYQGYQTWGGDKMIEANVYEYNTDPVGKLSCGNSVYFWRKTDTDMYSDYYFGFHFIDADGTEWKTVWYASNWQATFVSMTQV